MQVNYTIIYKGSYKPYRKEVILSKVGEHYHACTSLKAFMGRNHFCLRCEKGFDHDNMRFHACNGRKCGSCFQTECEEYTKFKKGTEQLTSVEDGNEKSLEPIA